MLHPLSLFRFCPRCGSGIFGVHDERSKRCFNCGFTYYHNAAAATVAVVRSARDELLVCRRAFEPAKGTLDLPGGFVNPGESLDEGCLREVREETGAIGRIVRYLFSLPNTYEYSGFTVNTTDAFFEVEILDENAIFAHDDVAELFWMKPQDLRPEDFGLTSVRNGVERLLQTLL